MSTWILVCDASRAVLYGTEKRDDKWQVLRSLSEPESRMKSSELTPTEPGHAAKSKGGTRHTAFENSTTAKDASISRFAQKLAQVLDEGVDGRQYERLVLVAPPRFLGLLKQRLSAETEARLYATVNKDYTLCDAREVREWLLESVFAPLVPTKA